VLSTTESVLDMSPSSPAALARSRRRGRCSRLPSRRGGSICWMVQSPGDRLPDFDLLGLVLVVSDLDLPRGVGRAVAERTPFGLLAVRDHVEGGRARLHRIQVTHGALRTMVVRTGRRPDARSSCGGLRSRDTRGHARGARAPCAQASRRRPLVAIERHSAGSNGQLESSGTDLGSMKKATAASRTHVLARNWPCTAHAERIAAGSEHVHFPARGLGGATVPEW
jgi:hypothetical protein